MREWDAKKQEQNLVQSKRRKETTNEDNTGLQQDGGRLPPLLRKGYKRKQSFEVILVEGE